MPYRCTSCMQFSLRATTKTYVRCHIRDVIVPKSRIPSRSSNSRRPQRTLAGRTVQPSPLIEVDWGSVSVLVASVCEVSIAKKPSCSKRLLWQQVSPWQVGFGVLFMCWLVSALSDAFDLIRWSNTRYDGLLHRMHFELSELGCFGVESSFRKCTFECTCTCMEQTHADVQRDDVLWQVRHLIS